ncbi:hypothetical protein HPB47_024262 [Ixodes persulcatus]|uniref:Uncharacterized protein n=1 Tax=Ixodes persulcatus TaxID=34615 RepID=A0AC60Q523_IXOPE|nr:hypothetical protein HPB47_024262 [Ixodes persulcatus]
MNKTICDAGLIPPTGKIINRTIDPLLYVNDNGLQWFCNSQALEELKTSFKAETIGDHGQILDLGCGTGDFTRNGLLPRCLPCRRIVAVDSSHDMIDYASKHFAHPNICYDVLDAAGDVSGLVERYGQFDRVYSFFALHFVKDQEKALKNIARLMRPGGECLLLFCSRSTGMQVLRAIGTMERWRKHADLCESLVPASVDLVDKEDIVAYFSGLLSAANLKPTTCKVTFERRKNIVLDDLIRFHLSVCPILPLLEEQEKAYLAEDIAQQLRKWMAEDELGSSWISAQVVLVHAFKPCA